MILDYIVLSKVFVHVWEHGIIAKINLIVRCVTKHVITLVEKEKNSHRGQTELN